MSCEGRQKAEAGEGKNGWKWCGVVRRRWTRKQTEWLEARRRGWLQRTGKSGTGRLQDDDERGQGQGRYARRRNRVAGVQQDGVVR